MPKEMVVFNIKVTHGANVGDLGIGLATNRVFVRSAYNGDVNLDGYVNGDDLNQITGLGYYGELVCPDAWLDGDLNGDGKVDGDDLNIIVGSANYGNPVKYGA